MRHRHPAEQASRGAAARLAAGLLVALVLAGCGAGTAATAAPPSGPAALPAGTYGSIRFQPPVTVTVPDGWRIGSDSALYFSLLPVDSEVLGVYLFRDPRIASQDETCAASPEPGVGATSSELVAWITGHPGLVTTRPVMASLGGLRGVAVDVALDAAWIASCPFANGVPAVPLFNSPEIEHWVVVGNERLRLHLFDLPGGGTLVVDVDAFDGSQFDAFEGRASAILRGLEIDAAAGASGGPAASAPAASP